MKNMIKLIKDLKKDWAIGNLGSRGRIKYKYTKSLE